MIPPVVGALSVPKVTKPAVVLRVLALSQIWLVPSVTFDVIVSVLAEPLATRMPPPSIWSALILGLAVLPPARVTAGEVFKIVSLLMSKFLPSVVFRLDAAGVVVLKNTLVVPEPGNCR